ncbi:MAG: hypothetical protein J4G05_00610 [Chlorobi bacterium]|nr:hypothetical protein [Chlorobiota bacterium]
MKILRTSRMHLSFLLLGVLTFSGCLTASRKILKFNMKDDGSGTGSMTFVNIMSVQDGETDQSLEDYSELVNKWLYGTEFEDANPNLQNVQKRLFARANRLYGEITFSFDYYGDVGLYRHQDTGPWMYYARLNTSNIEFFDTANGHYAGGSMPVIFWPEETRDFRIANGFNHGNNSVHSLYSLYDQLGVDPKEE